MCFLVNHLLEPSIDDIGMHGIDSVECLQECWNVINFFCLLFDTNTWGHLKKITWNSYYTIIIIGIFIIIINIIIVIVINIIIINVIIIIIVIITNIIIINTLLLSSTYLCLTNHINQNHQAHPEHVLDYRP